VQTVCLVTAGQHRTPQNAIGRPQGLMTILQIQPFRILIFK